MSERLFKVTSPFEPAGDQPKAIKQLVDGIDAGLKAQTLLGVTGSGKTFTMAKIIEAVQRPTIVMVHNKTLAAQLYGEFKDFFPDNAVEYFVSYYDYYQPEAYVPSSDTFIDKDSSINEHVEQMRLSATKALLDRKDVLIVATVSAIYGLGDPDSYSKMRMHLSRGEIIDQRGILRHLATLQYTRNDIDFHRGTYRVKGDVIDIYPAESDFEALRVMLFDEEIEELALFDPLTGEILKKLPRYTVYPKSLYVTPKETVDRAILTIEAELKERLVYLQRENRLVEKQRIEQRTNYDLEMLKELGYCNGIENYSRHFTGLAQGVAPPTLYDYLPDNALLIADESHVSIPQIGGMYKGDRSRKETLVEYGFRLPSALDNRPLKFEEWEERAPQAIFVSATPGTYEQEHSQATAEQVVRPTGLIDPVVEIRPQSTQVDDLMFEAKERIKVGERVFVTTLTKRMAEDLTDYLAENGIKVRYLHSDIDTVERVEILRDLRLGVFDVLVGINLLREGLDIPEVSLVAILDADKEGFLRSERSLIQTIGRAARNLNGRAILYADKITNSIQKALDETDRRRTKQIQFNKENNIIPRGVVKSVKDIMEGARVPGKGHPSYKSRADLKKVAEKLGVYDIDHPMSSDQLLKQISTLEDEMYKAAKAMKFEQAAQIRDDWINLKEQLKRSPV